MKPSLEENLHYYIISAIEQFCSAHVQYNKDIKVDGTVCLVCDGRAVVISVLNDYFHNGDDSLRGSEAQSKTYFVDTQARSGNEDGAVNVDTGNIKSEQSEHDTEYEGASHPLEVISQPTSITVKEDPHDKTGEDFCEQLNLCADEQGNFRCPFCVKNYAHKYNLKQHVILKHAPKQKKHICKYCGQNFKYNASLLSHVKRKHYEALSSLFQCPICQHRHINEAALKQHFTRKHPEIAYIGASTQASATHPDSYKNLNAASSHSSPDKQGYADAAGFMNDGENSTASEINTSLCDDDHQILESNPPPEIDESVITNQPLRAISYRGLVRQRKVSPKRNRVKNEIISDNEDQPNCDTKEQSSDSETNTSYNDTKDEHYAAEHTGTSPQCQGLPGANGEGTMEGDFLQAENDSGEDMPDYSGPSIMNETPGDTLETDQYTSDRNPCDNRRILEIVPDLSVYMKAMESQLPAAESQLPVAEMDLSHTSQGSSSPEKRQYRKFYDKIQLPDEKLIYKCSQCEKTFKNRSTVIQHLDTHFGVQPHVCRYCGERFTYRGSLHNHVMYKHAENRESAKQNYAHKCSTCGKKFRFPSEIKRHLETYPSHISQDTREIATKMSELNSSTEFASG